jgi:hypothetical protein
VELKILKMPLVCSVDLEKRRKSRWGYQFGGLLPFIGEVMKAWKEYRSGDRNTTWT